jgi:hypothetical protein
MKSSEARRILTGLAAALAAIALAACGGGGGGGSTSAGGGGGGQTITQQIAACEQGLGTTNPGTYANQMPVLLDGGPCAYFTPSGASSASVQQVGSLNQPFTTVTVCVPGAAQGSNSCLTVDHVLIDTGSFGLRLVSDPNNSTTSSFLASLPGVTVSGSQVYECAPFASGVSWGSVRSADIYIGGEKSTALAPIGGVSIHVIGDSEGNIPGACTSQAAGGTTQDTVDTLSANGVLGVGLFLSDCGSTCTTSGNSFYFNCPSSGCVSAGVPASQQVANPVSFFGADNNGVILSIGALASGSGAVTLSGTLTFGINTQSGSSTEAANQTAASLNAYLADQCGNFSTFITSLNGTAIANSDPINATQGTNCASTTVVQASLSFIDSGSNGVFFPIPSGTSGNTIATSDIPSSCSSCSWYTPATTAAVGTSIIDYAGTPIAVPFTVQNADTLSNLNGGNDNVLAGLAAPSSSVGNVAGTDWGVPFFFGRPVYVAFEAIAPAGALNTISFPTSPVTSYNGPFWAF